jgi:hypothetical protein
MSAISKVNPLYQINPETAAKALQRKAFWMDVAVKVVTATTALFMVGVLGVSFGIGASLAWLPYALFGLTLALPLLAIGFTKLQAKRDGLKAERAFAEMIANQYRAITKMSVPALQKELSALGIQTAYPKLLSPILARYRVYTQIQEETLKEYAKALSFRHASGQAVDITRKEAYHLYEHRLLPAAFEAALCVEIMRNSSLQATSVSQIGTFRCQDLGQRVCANVLDGDDTYFTRKGHPSIDLASIDPTPLVPKHISPEQIRVRLFPTYATQQTGAA